MRTWIFTIIALLAMPPATAFAAGKNISYEIDGQAYEGYYISPDAGAPLRWCC